MEAAEAVAAAKAAKSPAELPHVFTGSVEHAIAHIEEPASRASVRTTSSRWYAVKIFERDDKVLEQAEPHRRPRRPSEDIEAARRSWTTTPRASSPTSATRTSRTSSRAAYKKKAPARSDHLR